MYTVLGPLRPFQCTSCPLVCRNPGSQATHVVSCRRKRKLQEAAVTAAQQATEFQQRTREHVGRRLWTTDHNDTCENGYGTGELLHYIVTRCGIYIVLLKCSWRRPLVIGCAACVRKRSAMART
jgi:hypothetical protein